MGKFEAGPYRYFVDYDEPNDQIKISQWSVYGSHGTIWIDAKDASKLADALKALTLDCTHREPA